MTLSCIAEISHGLLGLTNPEHAKKRNTKKVARYGAW
jgi:hypothetical protein